MKKIDVPMSGYSGKWTLPGYEVPDTNGTLAVHKQNGPWQLTHIPTGHGLFSLSVVTRADGVEAAQCFYRACRRIKIDLRRRKKFHDGAETRYLAEACAKWFRPMRAVG